MKAVLVTGAGRGIGAAIARELAAPERTLYLNFKADEKSAKKVAADVEALRAKAVLRRADVTKPAEVDRMFEGIGGLDVLVVNAGVPYAYDRIATSKWADWETQWHVQIHGAFLVCRKALPLLAKQGGDVVFVLSSVVASEPPPFMGAYVTAKYAALGFAHSLKAEVRPKGIRVHCVMPGMTRTDFIKDFPRPVVAAEEEAGRLHTPEETAKEVAGLLSAARA